MYNFTDLTAQLSDDSAQVGYFNHTGVEVVAHKVLDFRMPVNPHEGDHYIAPEVDVSGGIIHIRLEEADNNNINTITEYLNKNTGWSGVSRTTWTKVAPNIYRLEVKK